MARDGRPGLARHAGRRTLSIANLEGLHFRDLAIFERRARRAPRAAYDAPVRRLAGCGRRIGAAAEREAPDGAQGRGDAGDGAGRPDGPLTGRVRSPSAGRAHGARIGAASGGPRRRRRAMRDEIEPMRTVSETVWDPFVRLFHWGLAGCVAAAAVTGFLLDATWIEVHLWAGTVGLTLVAARTLWGFWGPTHARFADFVTGPRAALAHLRDLRDGRVHRHRGHNPLGGLMVVTLMTVVALLALTGALAYGGVLKSGPFAFAASFAEGRTAREIHEALAIGLLALVALHVGGVVFESRRLRENLARAMIDGRKAVRPGDAPTRPVRARTGAAILVGAGVFAVTAAVAGKLAERPAANMPVATLDPTYVAECGACHTAYHPSLLPRASWRALMAGLDDHFGEDAWLPEETVAEIGAWLDANAAESADTLPANLLRRVNPENPIAITATPFWTRMHAEIPDAVFASAPVGGRGRCQACHADAASGRFHPSAIAIPKETTR